VKRETLVSLKIAEISFSAAWYSSQEILQFISFIHDISFIRFQLTLKSARILYEFIFPPSRLTN